MSEPTAGKWTYSPQSGARGHCLMAQVWADGKCLAIIEDTADPGEATANARLFAASKRMLEACRAALPGAEEMKLLGPNGEDVAKMLRDAIAQATA